MVLTGIPLYEPGLTTAAMALTGIPLYKPGLTTAAIPRPGDGVTVYKPYVFDNLPPGAGAKSMAHSRRMHA